MKGKSARGAQKIVEDRWNIVKVIIQNPRSRIACNPLPPGNMNRGDLALGNSDHEIQRVKAKINSVCDLRDSYWSGCELHPDTARLNGLVLMKGNVAILAQISHHPGKKETHCAS